MVADTGGRHRGPRWSLFRGAVAASSASARRCVIQLSCEGVGFRRAFVEFSVQAIPPFYLQDRFCTSSSVDTQRLYYLSGRLNLANSKAEDWKLEIVTTPLTALR